MMLKTIIATVNTVANGDSEGDGSGGGGGGLEKITPYSTFKPCKMTVIVSVLAG